MTKVWLGAVEGKGGHMSDEVGCDCIWSQGLGESGKYFIREKVNSTSCKVMKQDQR